MAAGAPPTTSALLGSHQELARGRRHRRRPRRPVIRGTARGGR
jgi:hypothetical protein